MRKSTTITGRLKPQLNCHAFKLGISSEQDAKPAAWLRLTHYKDFVIIDITAFCSAMRYIVDPPRIPLKKGDFDRLYWRGTP